MILSLIEWTLKDNGRLDKELKRDMITQHQCRTMNLTLTRRTGTEKERAYQRRSQIVGMQECSFLQMSCQR